MISHQEAEVLTSARQDAPLDPVVERELQAHLATCDQCRAFAAATERLSAGLRSLPTVASNPRVKREVMERVRGGRGPLAGLFGGFGAGFQPGPALAAVALVAVIGIFGWFALDRVILNGDDDGNNQIAAVPTEQVTQENYAPTATEVANTVVPTEVAPTETTAPEPTATTAAEPTAPPEPTATTAPEPTAPPEPTATTAPEPTATMAPEPTAPPEPTATTAPEPTATTEPTAESVDEGPVDLTTTNTESNPTPTPTVEATEEPTETETVAALMTTEVATEEPTVEETAVPSPTPTETEVATEAPTETEVATETETAVPTPSPTVGIEPMDGSTSVPISGDDNAGTEAAGDGTGGTEVPADAVGGDDSTAEGTGDAASGESGDNVIVPMDGEVVDAPGNPDATVEPTNDDGEPAGIEPIAPDGEADPNATAEPDATGGVATEEATAEPTEESGGQSILDVSEPYSGIAGDPAGKLGLTPEGRMEFMAVPDGASMTTDEGYQLQMPDAQPGVVQLCGDGFCEPSMEAPEDEGWLGDAPLGYIEGTAYVMRMYGDRTEIYAATPSGTQLVEPSIAAEIGPTSPPAAVYRTGSSLYAWLPDGQWLTLSGGSGQTLSGTFADPTNVRFAPSPNGGPLIGYFSGGSLIVAPVTAPDAAIFNMPTEGVDFDISPPGDQVAMIEGNNIVIYDIQGNRVMVYEGGDMQPGSVIWLNSGLVWVDRATGALYQIPETGN